MQISELAGLHAESVSVNAQIQCNLRSMITWTRLDDREFINSSKRNAARRATDLSIYREREIAGRNQHKK